MLKVKKSRIKGAGMGLFTTSPIRKGDVVIEYKGEHITWAECLRRQEIDGLRASYMFYISSKNCVDAMKTPEALARYANDAEGYKKIKGLKNNCDYEVIKSKPYIVAKKNIPAGAELYVEYGKDYWDLIAEELKNKEEKIKKGAKGKKKAKGK